MGDRSFGGNKNAGIQNLRSQPAKQIRQIRGYVLLRFVTRLPGKRNIHAACAILPQFYDCIWFGAPDSRNRAELLAGQIKKLLK